MYNYIELVILLLVALLSCNKEKKTSNKEQPNFIIIQADDLGWDDLALNGNKHVNNANQGLNN